MARSNDSPPLADPGKLPPLPVTSLDQQYTRQHVHEGWQPKGFQRYQYQKALLDGMPVLGGPGDRYGANPARYVPVPSCNETLDCHCGEK